MRNGSLDPIGYSGRRPLPSAMCQESSFIVEAAVIATRNHGIDFAEPISGRLDNVVHAIGPAAS